VDRYPDAAAVTVIGGASQGGGRAAAIALTGDPFSCRGLVAVVSAYPDVPDVAGAARDAGARALRAYLLTGDRDTTRDQVEHLYADLLAGGVEAKQEVVPDLGHEFPNDFPSACDALSYSSSTTDGVKRETSLRDAAPLFQRRAVDS
jgi:acetyl esterase/lipase